MREIRHSILEIDDELPDRVLDLIRAVEHHIVQFAEVPLFQGSTSKRLTKFLVLKMLDLIPEYSDLRFTLREDPATGAVDAVDYSVVRTDDLAIRLTIEALEFVSASNH